MTIKAKAVDQSDYYLGFYWNPEANRWYPSGWGQVQLTAGATTYKTLITPLARTAKFVVGELNHSHKRVTVTNSELQS